MISLKIARLPLPEKGFKITRLIISFGSENNENIGDKRLIVISKSPLTFISSFITKIADKYGKSEKINGRVSDTPFMNKSYTFCFFIIEYKKSKTTKMGII